MNRYMLVAAFALVLAAPVARAEYTGHGAISSSSSSGAADHAGADARQSLKEHWDNLKESQAQNWDKLEAARRAHWHVPNLLHKATGADPAPAAGTDAGGEGRQASGNPPVQAADGSVRASKWEKFKADHQEQKAGVEAHLEAAKDKTHAGIQNWKDEHKDTLANAKEKVEQWKENHQESLTALTEKLHFHRKDQ